jgi:hypothetical protein
MGGLAVTAQLDDGALLAGWAAFYGPSPSPEALRRHASRLAYEGLSALDETSGSAEPLLRRAIELMVDAFLLDRRSNGDLFRRAHVLGALVRRRFSCQWRSDDYGRLDNTCGILALHSRVGFSPGGKSWGRCSICGAEDFCCDHVPGRTYDGQRCFRTIYRFDTEEVSLTPRPRDPRCFRVRSPTPAGTTSTVACSHCISCAGQIGPREVDVVTDSWPEDRETLIRETVAISETARSPLSGLP